MLVLVAVGAQIARNWLMLQSTGIPVSLLDSIAVLIAIVTLTQLPVGPSVGAAATVLILGGHGVAAVAAAGVLLTATGIAGALSFAGWALVDRIWGLVTARARRDPSYAKGHGGFSRRAAAARVSQVRPHLVGDRAAVPVLPCAVHAAAGRAPVDARRDRRGRAARRAGDVHHRRQPVRRPRQ